MRMKWVLCAVLVCSSRVFAQSAPGTFSLDHSSFAPAHEYVAADAVPRRLALPPNLLVSRQYRRTVEEMLERSPTFRRQCVRINAEPKLTVHLALGNPLRRADSRAATRITRSSGGRIDAFIEVFPLDDDVELIAHEIEHVIEQLDEVDLASLAAQGGSGVQVLDGRAFETIRARHIGLRVTGEVGKLSQRR